MVEKIRFITDTACDIPLDVAENYGIDVAPLTVAVDGVTYKESYEITPQKFYQLCRECKELPVSSGVNAQEYLERYEKALRDGCTNVCVVCINSGGSMCYASANRAREEFYEEHPDARQKMEIEILDSRTYSIAYGIPVLRAAEMHRRGVALADIRAFFQDWFDRVEIYFAPLTFDFVKRSGRVSGITCLAGQALGLRPIIDIIEGKTHAAAVVRGDRNVPGAIVKIAQERAVKGTPYGILVGTVTGLAEDLSAKLQKAIGDGLAGIFSAGPAITINGGPDLLAMCFLGAKRQTGTAG